MFSLLSLYFAYRRDVIAAERHMAGLVRTEAPVADTVAPTPVEERLPLAA